MKFRRSYSGIWYSVLWHEAHERHHEAPARLSGLHQSIKRAGKPHAGPAGGCGLYRPDSKLQRLYRNPDRSGPTKPDHAGTWMRTKSHHRRLPSTWPARKYPAWPICSGACNGPSLSRFCPMNPGGINSTPGFRWSRASTCASKKSIFCRKKLPIIS